MLELRVGILMLEVGGGGRGGREEEWICEYGSENSLCGM